MKSVKKKRIYLISSISILITLLGSIQLTATEESVQTNTPSGIASPRNAYPLLFTINADNAFLIKKNDQHYELILEDIYKNIVYTYSYPHKKNGILSTDKFINAWKLMNREVTADVTGIQINPNTIGHTQFYASVLLKNPIQNTKMGEIAFDLISKKYRLNVFRSARFENVTIFINGCDLCDCGKEEIRCASGLK